MRFTETATLVILAARAGFALRGEYNDVKALIVRDDQDAEAATAQPVYEAAPPSYDGTGNSSQKPDSPTPKLPAAPSYLAAPQDDPDTPAQPAAPSYQPATQDDPDKPAHHSNGGSIPGFPYCVGQFAYEGCPYCPPWYPGPAPPAPPPDNPCQYGCDPQWCPWKCEIPTKPCSDDEDTASGCYNPPIPCSGDSAQSDSGCILPPVPCSDDATSGCYNPIPLCPYSTSVDSASDGCIPICSPDASGDSSDGCIPICTSSSSSLSSDGCIPICPAGSSGSSDDNGNPCVPIDDCPDCECDDCDDNDDDDGDNDDDDDDDDGSAAGGGLTGGGLTGGGLTGILGGILRK